MEGIELLHNAAQVYKINRVTNTERENGLR